MEAHLLDLLSREHTRGVVHAERAAACRTRFRDSWPPSAAPITTNHFHSSQVLRSGFSSIAPYDRTRDAVMSVDRYLPNFRLDGKVALVTGASRGIGFGLARALAEFGAKVAIAAREQQALTELAATIPGALPIPMDMRSIASIREGIARVETHFGRLDVLVNNAGIGANHPALNVTENDWDEIMDVNL